MPDILNQTGATLETADGTIPFVGIRSRFLPPEEWDRLRNYGPFLEAGSVLPDKDHAIVLVLERYDQRTSQPLIVGCWLARDIVMLEALYLSPGERGVAPSARQHLFSMVEELKARKVHQAITLIQSPQVQLLAAKAGFVELPGAVHLLTLPVEVEGT